MRIIEWETFLAQGLPLSKAYAAISVGVFDVVHRGHQALVDRITQTAKASPVIITFRQNHKNYTSLYPVDICSFSQKTAIFEALGIAIMVVAELSDSFRRMSGPEFFRLLREHGKMGFLAVGSNFRCGHHLDTDAPAIRQLNSREGIHTDIVETLTDDGTPISSTRIRESIRQGRLTEAAAMLGRPYILDLRDASHDRKGSSCIYSIAPLGRVLPPPGEYQVILQENKHRTEACIPIEKDLVQIPHPVEFIEFR